MGARAEAVAATRQKILDAAKTLHAETGVSGTRWEDIAERSGVALATVYRHFPSLSELVPACARSVFDIVKPPTIEEASIRFAEIADPVERLRELVRRSIYCFGLDEGWLHAAYRERDFLPELDAALEVIQGTLHVLVDAAAGRKLSKGEHALFFTLCDFPFYRSLLDAGLDRRGAEHEILELVASVWKDNPS